MNRWNCCLVSLCLLAAANLASAYTTDTLQVPSAKMNKDVPVIVLLPNSYQSGSGTFPVWYMLHGAGDDATAWPRKTAIGQMADIYGFIVVCPDAGTTSWYFDSPIDPAYQYETFVSSELVGYIDGHYRTRLGAAFRAIGGNSMGGHGALFLSIRHPDVFGVAVGFSGGYDLTPFPKNWDIAMRIGAYKSHKKLWKELSVVTQAKKLANNRIAISFECGVDDFFIKNNRELHQILLKNKIDHEYTERPGIHGWVYWRPNLQYQALFVAKQFEKAEKDSFVSGRIVQ
ncbi:MAG: alpha/beta hydrolase family protein [Candidatus Sumerlaeia bacterium]